MRLNMQRRKYGIGAEILKQGVHFRVWAPKHKQVYLILEDTDPAISHKMHSEKNGYHSLLVKEAKEGSLYRFRLKKNGPLFADPASREQPIGPDGPSRVVNRSFLWNDKKWKGAHLEGQIIYEIHIGTFTEKGTFSSAMDKLPYLADLGVTMLELMPVNDFPGHFGWGYDGVNLFAPSRLYGSPRDLKAFVNRAHSLGLAVILDVVYNHLGPEGNQMCAFSQDYLHSKNRTDWGQAINFDHPESRKYFLTNVSYWIEEFHFDGLRVDATPWFFSNTSQHILAELTATAKKAGGKRSIVMIGENEPQDTTLLKPYNQGGYGFDALWNDDFHHTAMVRLIGKREAYYTDYLGSPQEFISALKYGFLYQGQYYEWQKKERGTLWLDMPPAAMVLFLENHDQLANSGHGKRLWQQAEPGNLKAMTALLLLSPCTPMLFQGQEFFSSKPFYYFADHSDALNSLIEKGRKRSLAQFPRLATREIKRELMNPSDPIAFTHCKLDHKEVDDNLEIFTLHQDLIKLRKTDSVFQHMQSLRYDGAVLSNDSFLIRYFGEENEDCLLIINFGPDHYFNPAPEPLLVAGVNMTWEILWSSESVKYGGGGTPPINIPYWKILGHSAMVLKSKPKNEQP